MFRYSLSELFYWLTVWIVAVSALGTLMTAPHAVFVVTIWLFGTVLVMKAFGYRASFAYSVLVGFVLMAAFLWPTIQPAPRRRPSFELHYTLSFLSGLISGTTIWCVAAAADEVFKWSVRRRTE